jgi:hypothetical protein
VGSRHDQICHNATLPQETTAVGLDWADPANDLAAVVDVEWRSALFPQRAELNPSPLLLSQRARSCVRPPAIADVGACSKRLSVHVHASRGLTGRRGWYIAPRCIHECRRNPLALEEGTLSQLFEEKSWPIRTCIADG